jgi:uncharacterized protein with NRDE domain
VDGLCSPHSAERVLGGLDDVEGGHGPFNLLVGDAETVWWRSNRGGRGPERLLSGVHGLSNHLLDTPWPKVAGGRVAMEAALTLYGDDLVAALFELLADRSRPPDEELPDTGVGLELERLLAPRFIAGPVYGTRSSTVMTVSRRGRLRLSERTFTAGGRAGRTRHFRAPIVS